MSSRGRKDDEEKQRWDLLPLNAVELVVAVLTFGARKYDDDNWRKVVNSRRRYFAAALRHLKSWRAGERFDDETGLPHLAHAACCVLFLLSLDEGHDPPFSDEDGLGADRRDPPAATSPPPKWCSEDLDEIHWPGAA